MKAWLVEFIAPVGRWFRWYGRQLVRCQAGKKRYVRSIHRPHLLSSCQGSLDAYHLSHLSTIFVNTGVDRRN